MAQATLELPGTTMPFHAAFQNIDDSERERILTYWRSHWHKVERLLRRVDPELRQLRLVVRKHPRYYDVRTVLMLPSATLAAHEDRPKWKDALRAAMLELRRQLVDHKERAWEAYRHGHKVQRAESFERNVKSLEKMYEAGMREALTETLRATMRSLREYARHELVLSQLEGRIAPGSLTVGDVLDEAVARAWEGWKDRPADLSLEQWLTGLIHAVIDDAAERQSAERHLAPVHLEETIAEDDPRYRAEVGWIQDNEPFWEPDVVLRLEDVIPNPETPEPWETLDEGTQRRLVASELVQLPRELRRAIALVRYQGWSVEEVARLFRRDVEEIKDQLESAAAKLATRIFERARALMGAEEETDENSVQQAAG